MNSSPQVRHMDQKWVVEKGIQSVITWSLESDIIRCGICKHSIVYFKPYNHEIFLYKPKGFFSTWNIIHVLFRSFCFLWISMLRVYGHYKKHDFFSVGVNFRRQNLTSVDVRFWRLKTIPTLKGSITLWLSYSSKMVTDKNWVFFPRVRGNCDGVIIDHTAVN